MDTIVALATPPGYGGVGIVRVSGDKACQIGLEIGHLQTLRPRFATYIDFHTQDGQVLDQGLLLYFKAPHSFTGEDVVEFQGHGSPVVLDLLVQTILQYGARLARPGEFSERAFLNDKMDLTQAEAIADLIHASSATAARMAVRSLQGEFSARIHAFNNELTNIRLFVEAAIDFPEEEIDFLSDGRIAGLLQSAIESLNVIRKEVTQGVIVREGMSVVIIGPPNAGKSTLINRLAEREVAIVTDIPGTTRDVMREQVLIDDLPMHIIDTAGLRDTNDLIEQEGIKRAWQEVKEADAILFVVDASQGEPAQSLYDTVQEALPKPIPIITVMNKLDKIPEQKPKEDLLRVYLSAKTGEGISTLKNTLKTLIGYQPLEGHFLARRRHLQALEIAYQHLLSGQKALNAHRAGELLAEDLRLAHQSLSEITGEFTSDDLLGKIFSSFCIGK